MIKGTIRIGTRGSALALAQANWTKDKIEKNNPGIGVELIIIKTKGDIMQDVALVKIGGKGVFVKEIEDALLRGDIDLAVHSMKDVPAILPGMSWSQKTGSSSRRCPRGPGSVPVPCAGAFRSAAFFRTWRLSPSAGTWIQD
jgi:hypothetical protein